MPVPPCLTRGPKYSVYTNPRAQHSFHIAEECSNAAVATPRSIVMTAASGSVLGFILNALIAYTIVDVDAVLESELVRISIISTSLFILCYLPMSLRPAPTC